jgi:hypothetical protein
VSTPASPLLSPSQLAALAEIGEERSAPAREVLYRVGDRTYPFVAIGGDGGPVRPCAPCPHRHRSMSAVSDVVARQVRLALVLRRFGRRLLPRERREEQKVAVDDRLGDFDQLVAVVL